MPGGLFGQCRALQQPGVEGRHPHQHGGVRHQLDDQVGIEFRQKDHRGPREQRDVAGHEQSVGVIDRQRVNQHVLIGKAPIVDQRQRIRCEIIVRQHRPLGTSRRTGCVEDRGEIIVGAGDGGERGARLGRGVSQRTLAVGAECQNLGADLGRNRADAFGLGGIAYHQRRLGVGNEIFQLVQRVGGVERQVNRAGAYRGEIQYQARHRFFGLSRDAITGLDAGVNQDIRHLSGAGHEVAVADALPVDGFDREPGWIVELVEQARKQIGVHDGFLRRVHASFRAAASDQPHIFSRGSIAKRPFTKQRRRFACQITGNAWPG